MLYFPTWQKIAIIAICLLGFLFALPNVWYQRADTAARAQAAIEAGRYGGEGQPDLATLEQQAALWPGWLPGGVVNLGLDLRGGVHLLVDVQVQEVFAEHLQGLRRSRLRRAARGRHRPPDRRRGRPRRSSRSPIPPTWPAPRACCSGLARPTGGFGLGGGRRAPTPW